jgi:hypothetical protein
MTYVREKPRELLTVKFLSYAIELARTINQNLCISILIFYTQQLRIKIHYCFKIPTEWTQKPDGIFPHYPPAVTHYGLDGPEIEFRWGVRFSAPVQTGAGAHPVLYTMGTGSLSQGVKRPGRGVNHPPPSRLSGLSWPVLVWNLPFNLSNSGGGYTNCSSPTLCYHPPSFLVDTSFDITLNFEL